MIIVLMNESGTFAPCLRGIRAHSLLGEDYRLATPRPLALYRPAPAYRSVRSAYSGVSIVSLVVPGIVRVPP